MIPSKFPAIAVQFDDFDEWFEVIKNVGHAAYRELAKFKDREEAFEYAHAKAEKESLGDVIDLTTDDEDE